VTCLLRAAWALAFALLAAGCAQLETGPAADQVFELTGRLAARQGEQAFTGNLSWRHAGSADELLVTSPIGQGVARIVRNGDSVVLTTAEPREYRAPDVESLTEQALGFRLPLKGLADWVRARPAPGRPAKVEKGPDGRIASLEQNGWRIEYLAYEEGLPSRMRLAYPGIDLRLAISAWK
jgi:outer membrane lipoprotein LolB